MLGAGPDATQWDQIEVAGDCADKVLRRWKKRRPGELIFHDDTACGCRR